MVEEEEEDEEEEDLWLSLSTSGGDLGALH